MITEEYRCPQTGDQPSDYDPRVYNRRVVLTGDYMENVNIAGVPVTLKIVEWHAGGYPKPWVVLNIHCWRPAE